MALVAFTDLAGGVIRDRQPHHLKVTEWSDARNVRFQDNAVEVMPGHQQVFGTPLGAPWWAIPVSGSGVYLWVYAGEEALWATSGEAHADITRLSGAYNMTPAFGWNGGVLGGIVIANNGLDVPQAWLTPDLDTRMVDLANWPANMRARVVVPYKQYLIAADIDEGDGYNRRLLRSSSPAIPGEVPASWDYADPTQRAVRFELAETVDSIVWMQTLKDVNVIYKENVTWGMQWIGGNDVFRFYKMFDSFGALSRRCVASFHGGHLVFGDGDVVIHNGAEVQSVVDNRIRRWLFTNIDQTHYERSFVAANYAENEAWLCFPMVGAELPNMALVWNWSENTFSMRELPGVAHIASGLVDPSIDGDTIDTLSGTIDTLQGWFDQQSFNPTKRALLMCGTANTKLYQLDSSTQFDGGDFPAYAERLALPLGRNQGDQEIATLKYIKAVYPEITGDGTVDVLIGVQETFDGTVFWHGPYTFEIGVDFKVDCRVTGRLIGVRFQSRTSRNWKLNGYRIEREIVGWY